MGVLTLNYLNNRCEMSRDTKTWGSVCKLITDILMQNRGIPRTPTDFGCEMRRVGLWLQLVTYSASEGTQALAF